MRIHAPLLIACSIAVAVASGAAAQSDPSSLFDLIADPEVDPYEINGSGFVTSSGHPMHPGDFQRIDIGFRLMMDPELGESIIEVASGEGEEKDVDRYFVRRGRIFQVEEVAASPGRGSVASGGSAADSSGAAKAPREITAKHLGDLASATVAALHPAIVANAMLERRENTMASAVTVFAWNDAFWHVAWDIGSSRIQKLERRTYDDRLGDGIEEVRYEGWASDGEKLMPGRVVVSARGRELARIDFGPIEHRSRRAIASADAGALGAATGSGGAGAAGLVEGWPAFPVVDDELDLDAMVVAERELALREIAPHIFTIDIASMNTRVIVAEFEDHLAVIEGVYNSRICDVIARVVRERLAKPVRWFAFSHLHGQYIGGVRSWIHEGATVLVPPTTAPLVEEMAAAPHLLRPDAFELARASYPPPVRVETVAKSRRLADAMNALELFNVESDHTDEYFITYFPGPKILLTGDLLFYRPGKPLTGRSKKLCDTVANLGLDVETYVCTWPLDGYGTKNVVTAEEMRAGCETAPR